MPHRIFSAAVRGTAGIQANQPNVLQYNPQPKIHDTPQIFNRQVTFFIPLEYKESVPFNGL